MSRLESWNNYVWRPATRGYSLSLVVAAMLLALGCSSAEEFPTIDRMAPGVFVEEEGTRAVLPQGTKVRKVYPRGLEHTKLAEGFEKRLYNDAAGYCTIGYGHLIKKSRCNGTEPAELRRGIDQARGTTLLASDMELAEIAVMTSVKVPLTDGQFAALADFVFNVGGGNFRKSTLLKAVNQRQDDRVPFQMRRWVKAGGRELPGLKRRREGALALYFEGKTIPRAVPSPDEDLSEIDVLTGEPGEP